VVVTEPERPTGQLSPDGRWRWDGSRWQPVRSEDGRWRWDGSSWTSERLDETRFEATYNPIRGVEPKPSLLRKRQRPEPGTAVVFYQEDRLTVVTPPSADPEHGAEGTHLPGLFDRVHKLYRIDISDHTIELDTELPSRGDAVPFSARLHFTCSVRRPAVIVEKMITDAGAALRPPLEAEMRAVSRSYAAERSADAERAVAARLEERERLGGFHPAFRLAGIVLRLDLDPATRTHAATLRGLERGKEVVDLEEDLEDLRHTRDLNRSTKYREYVEAGDWALLSLYLAQNRGHLGAVLQAMKEKRDGGFRTTMEALRFLLDSNLIESAQLEELGELMGQNLLDLMRPRRPAPLPPPPEELPDEK